jgi:hypothetical protein
MKLNKRGGGENNSKEADYLTLSFVLSLNNPQNSEICVNMKLTR